MGNNLKFRIWSTRGGYFPDHSLLSKPVFFITTNGKIWDSNIQNIRKDLILSQFTGLCDKTGKEIYEGDVIRLFIPANDTPEVSEIHKIIFEGGSFCFEDGFFIGNLAEEYYQVIGNIYENPELVKQ